MVFFSVLSVDSVVNLFGLTSQEEYSPVLRGT